MLMGTRNLKRGNKQVYINHDLTLAEHKERKHLLPNFGLAEREKFLAPFPATVSFIMQNL